MSFILISLVLFGCALGERFAVKVNSINDGPGTTYYRSYVLLPGLKDVDPSNLQFKEFAGYVERALTYQGYKRVNSFQDADLAIFLAYGIGDPQTQYYSYSLPIYGQTGVSSSTTTGTLSRFGSNWDFQGFTTYQPTYGVIGYTTQVGALTSYFRFFILDAINLVEYKSSRKVVSIWRTTVTSTGSSGDLRRVFPVLAAASMPYITKNTGKQIDITLLENDKAVLDIKGVANIQQTETKSKEAKSYFDRGLAYYKTGQYDEAISEYTKVIEINPKVAEAYGNRGLAYGRKGQYDLAIADFNKAIEINPKVAEVYGNRAIAYGRKGQHDLAIADFNKVIEINPRDAIAYGSRGIAYRTKGQHDLAIADFNKAIEINPRDAIAYRNRGIAYGMKGQHDLAIADFNKAIEINPMNDRAYNSLAWLFATAEVSDFRNGKRAVELALRACELSHWKNLNFYDTLAAAYARVGDFENAVKYQQKALESPELAKDKEAQQRLNLYRELKPWPVD
jgi:tetratricopeptide (TPR) repeat protein